MKNSGTDLLILVEANGERLVLPGLSVGLFSSIFFAFGRAAYGVLVVVLGAGLFPAGFEARWIVSRRKRHPVN